MGSGAETHSKGSTSITGCIFVLNRLKENSEDEEKKVITSQNKNKLH